MEGRLLLKNCTLLAEGSLRSGMAVVVEEGLITQVVPDAQVPVRPGDWEVACRGRLVGPGRVDCHARLVGGLLEHAAVAHLETSEVEVLTRFALARALREGTTLAVEPWEGPGEVAWGLEAQARAAEQLGARLVVAPVSADATHAEAWAQAGADFARRYQSHPLVRGALGLHSSQVRAEGLLRQLASLREATGAPLLLRAEQGLGAQEVARLEAAGLLGSGTVVARAQVLEWAEAEQLARCGALLALEPGEAVLAGRSGAVLEQVLARRVPAGLGTGGQGSLTEAQGAARVQAVAAARAGRLTGVEEGLAWLLVEGVAGLGARLYGARCGVVEPGCLADLVVYGGVPAAEPGSGRVPGLVGWLLRAPVAWTVVAGRVVVREGQLLGTDGVALAQEAAWVLERVWARARLPGA